MGRTWGDATVLTLAAPSADAGAAHAAHAADGSAGDDACGVVVSCPNGAQLAAGATLAALLVALGAAGIAATWSPYPSGAQFPGADMALGIVHV